MIMSCIVPRAFFSTSADHRSFCMIITLALDIAITVNVMKKIKQLGLSTSTRIGFG
jgi:hypothetical protein